jgi:hypothetical protein
MNRGPDADLVVDLIDSERLAPRSHSVARAICRHIDLDAPDRALLALIDEKNVPDADGRLKELWHRITSQPVEREGIPRLLSALLIPDQEMDWFGAEMVVHWARQEGVSEEHICQAFGVDSSTRS